MQICKIFMHVFAWQVELGGCQVEEGGRQQNKIEGGGGHKLRLLNDTTKMSS